MLNNHSHFSLLERYLSQCDKLAWVIATIVNKAGSSYRSPGAIMLVNSLGQTHGLVSGGCLEANIVLHAKKVFDNQQAHYVEYDMLEEDGYAAELGVGCKGKIGVLLQFITAAHQTLLTRLYQRMHNGELSYLQQIFSAAAGEQHALNELSLFDNQGQLLLSTDAQNQQVKNAELEQMIKRDKAHINFSLAQTEISLTKISAPINFWIFGGGSDAVPLVLMARQMGWRVTVVDHRSSYARQSMFKDASDIFRLLGPLERRGNVEAIAEIADRAWLTKNVNGPVGLDIGGELPESIALSILAQCHSVLHQRSGLALSGKYING